MRVLLKKRSEDIVKEHDLDGLNCAICMEPWRSEGDHQVSCLPCGHLYGFSCISKWLQRPVPTTKCPQCNAKCKFKDIRKLYTTPVVVVDEGLQKKSDLLDLRDNLLDKESSMTGPVPGPIHTMYSLAQSPVLGSNSQKLLTASSMGPCVWNTDAGKRPYLVPGFENQGVCTSLAYGPLSDDIVASYHPKSMKSNSTVNSQCIDPDSSPFPGSATLCSQLLVKIIADSHYRNLGSTSAYLSNGQMARTAIINMQNCSPLFAYGDEATRGLRLKELPSFNVTQNLKPHHHPILDVKYAHDQDAGILGPVGEDKLQLFSAELLQKR
ncbi:E3 UBIQUITIN-PROTEIN LIGASE [Salix koriyanagi]|uniref:E3 UBIQUITIN-PROTEIN LIGASE n=1 Tax=Salix koriyanagi TaxID=2511006 RepID=A0A9Q0SAU1_9ROSI|nr:E3 UBIQUITIN-PROTEIN LIGASE [Salix koriyanagi]